MQEESGKPLATPPSLSQAVARGLTSPPLRPRDLSIGSLRREQRLGRPRVWCNAHVSNALDPWKPSAPKATSLKGLPCVRLAVGHRLGQLPADGTEVVVGEPHTPDLSLVR